MKPSPRGQSTGAFTDDCPGCSASAKHLKLGARFFVELSFHLGHEPRRESV